MNFITKEDLKKFVIGFGLLSSVVLGVCVFFFAVTLIGFVLVKLEFASPAQNSGDYTARGFAALGIVIMVFLLLAFTHFVGDCFIVIRKGRAEELEEKSKPKEEPHPEARGYGI